MNTRTLTSANAIIMIAVANLFDSPIKLEGFSAEDITDSESVQSLESSMGVDGRLSAGWTPVPTPQNITLQGDSLSNDLFENWDAAQQAVREVYVASGTILLPATRRKYAMTRGFLQNIARFPALKKTIQPRRYTIIWERVTAAPF